MLLRVVLALAVVLTFVVATVLGVEAHAGVQLLADRYYRLLTAAWSVSWVFVVVLAVGERHQRRIIALERRVARESAEDRLDRIVSLIDVTPPTPINRAQRRNRPAGW